MNLQNLTLKTQEVLQRAQQLAQEYTHQQIENSHILKAIFEVDENVTPFIFKKLGINIEMVKSINDKNLSSYAKVSGGEISFSNNASKMINSALIEAKKLKDEFVTIEHLFSFKPELTHATLVIE